MTQQAALFDSGLRGPMTISEVAGALSVSEASVRNWLKTGYLNYARRFDGKNTISRHSFEIFCTNVAGKEKLTKCANKLLLDEHNHDELVATTRAALGKAENIDALAMEYQCRLSNAYRNREGIYYTPDDICDSMFVDVPRPTTPQTFCDPCCGSGNFILAALRHGFRPENVYGYDTDPTAVEIAKQRIFEATGYETGNLICADFLELAASPNEARPTHDVILTNPPWGKKLPKAEKARYGKLLGAGRSLDTSSLFFFASLDILKEGGTLAFLLPESFFKIAIFQDARRELLRHSLISVRDFGKPFKGLVTRAQSFSMKKVVAERLASEKPVEVIPAMERATKEKAVIKSKPVLCVSKARSFKRIQKTFTQNPANIINFESCPQDAAVLSRLFGKPHLTLDGKASWGLGIVTGNNGKFCQSKLGKGLMPAYRGVDVHKGYLDAPTAFIPSDLSLYQQVAPVELFEAKEKILYRFISSDLVFCRDAEQSYCLNSVNMMILSDNFPVSSATVVKLFNTDLFNWAFGKLFNTHKILRSDLERMPIPVEFLKQGESFSEEELLQYYDIERGKDGTFELKDGDLEQAIRDAADRRKT